jgi:hypothetical protein
MLGEGKEVYNDRGVIDKRMTSLAYSLKVYLPNLSLQLFLCFVPYTEALKEEKLSLKS